MINAKLKKENIIKVGKHIDWLCDIYKEQIAAGDDDDDDDDDDSDDVNVNHIYNDSGDGDDDK